MTRLNIGAAGLVLAAVTFAAAPTHAAFSPLRSLAGTWSGGGMLSMASGERQPLRCRATYNVGGGGDEARINLRCASASYRFDLASNVAYRGGEITGDWSEASRNASGTISGRAAGDHIEAAARGQNFSANLSLTTRGNRQTVTIHPEGTEVRDVSLALNRH